MTKAHQTIQNLLNWCSRNSWTPSLETPVLTAALSATAEHAAIKKIFDRDYLVTSFAIHLDEFSKNSVLHFTLEDAKLFFNKVEKDLRSRITKHWVIVPLDFASLEKDIDFGKIKIITGSFEHKVKTLAKIASMSERTFSDRAQHTINSRSEDFYEHPLLVIEIKNHTSYIQLVAVRVAYYVTALILAIYWSEIHKPNTYELRAHAPRKRGGFLMIHTRSGWRWGHQPLRYHLDIKMEIDWLHKKAYRVLFTDCVKSIVTLMYQREFDRLNQRVFKALIFFGKALQENEEKGTFDGLGMPLTYLMIAFESLLHERNSEIKSRMVAIIPRIAQSKKYTPIECATAIDFGYSRRSDYVHGGNETYRQYEDLDVLPKEEKHFHTLVHMLAKIICDFPETMKDFDSQSQNNNSGQWRDNLWMDNSQVIWQKVIGLH